jgi:putative Ca2+/H+ antiporter (TMEM165/GDT1 family)
LSEPISDVGATSSSEISPSPRRDPTGRSAFVLAGGLAFFAAACYILTAHTTLGASVYEALSKSGFTAAFALIFVSELGDKTFFIAALLAMRLGRFTALTGAVSALSLMSVISVVIGRAFQSIPSTINDSLPIGEYLAVGLLFFFGVRTLREALATPETSGEESGESGELADAETAVNDYAAKTTKKEKTFIGKFWETFCLVFIAEWGDRSMLATIALGAAQNPVGVATGACFGHLVATLIAVVGGALLSKRISERQVGIAGGALFIVFAIATLAGVF